MNEEQEDITVGVTFFADLTEEEKVQYHGANVTEEVCSIKSWSLSSFRPIFPINILSQ